MKFIYTALSFVYLLFNAELFAQTYEEIQRLQKEYKNALERQSLQKPKAISDAENTAKSTALPDKLIYSRKDIESLLTNTEKLLIKLRFIEDSLSKSKMPFIGYDLFTQRDSIPFWQNLPISQNYIIGPGDEIIISLWGESNLSSSEFVNRDGEIFIENIGILNLGGKSLDDAKKYILSKFSKVYSTLIGQNPKSFLDLTLGELKSVNVHFLGFVNMPGVHLVHPFSNVINGLIQAGGVSNTGSLRNIKILRGNKIIAHIDIYKYLTEGIINQDIRLMDQDVIYVPARASTIPVTGAILRPGYYEVLENENISDLIKYSGGKDRRSSGSIFLFKNQSAKPESFIFDLNDNLNIKISDGDSISFPTAPPINNFVNIQGQIKNPGYYPFNNKMKLYDVLNATNSLQDEDFSRTMNLTKIRIFRKNISGPENLTIISDLADNILLKNGDFILVVPNNVFQPLETVTITGEINAPGKYPVNNFTKISDILNLSGGFTDFALVDGIEIFRDSLKIAWKNKSIMLEGGDSLNVLRKSGTVLVKGEVNVPGYITFKRNQTIADYINEAGGLTSFAEKRNIYVIEPNGSSFQNKRWFSPAIKEGSTIVVEERKLTGNRGVTGWQAFSIISSQAGNIATTILSISLLMAQSSSGN